MLITVVALLAYALIVFLGMEYLWEGIHEIALPLTLAGVAVLALCVYVMCKSKASRNKRQGLPSSSPLSSCIWEGLLSRSSSTYMIIRRN